MGNSTGHIFKVTTFGESHGKQVGATIDGCPPGLDIDMDALQADLDRRRPGQSALTTPRVERDQVTIVSGVFEGKTTGTPITLLFANDDRKPEAYEPTRNLFRPGHADFTYAARFGHRDHRGGGRASARETVARVAAAGIGRQVLRARWGVEVVGWVDQVADLAAQVNPETVTREQVERLAVRCPDDAISPSMTQLIEETRDDGDTVGGVVGCVARGVPAGWGSPVFDKLDADLAKACLSLPACRGFEIGSGFRGTRLRGSEHNDEFTSVDGQVSTATNRAGGTLGGISSGAPIVIRAAFKPVSTHFKTQRTVDSDGETVDFANTGRHDPCVLPRAVPLVEAAMLLVLTDHALRTLALGR